jgi:hypothetical protein
VLAGRQAGKQARYRQTGLLLLLASTTTTGTNTHYWRNPSATTAEVYDRGVTTGNGTGSARKRVCQPGGVFLERSLAVGVAVSVGLGNRSMGMGMAMRSWIMDYARSPDGWAAEDDNNKRWSSRHRPCITAVACAHPSGAVFAGLGVCSVILLLVLQLRWLPRWFERAAAPAGSPDHSAQTARRS